MSLRILTQPGQAGRKARLLVGGAIAVVIATLIALTTGGVIHIGGFSAASAARSVFLSSAPQFASNALCGSVARWQSISGKGFPAVNTGNCASTGNHPGSVTVSTQWSAIHVDAPTCESWVVYHTNRTGNWELFRSGKPGQPSTEIDLSHSTGANIDNVEPSLSPDRKWVAYASNRGGAWEIYAASTDGKAIQAVTDDSLSINVSPVWSPDGRSLVYESARNGTWNLFLFDVQSGQEQQLTDTQAADIDPFWSPDSRQIVFESQRSGSWQIYAFDVASQQVKQLTDGQGDDFNPMYSPDGKYIVFRAYRPDNSKLSVLFLMNADGSNPRAISDSHSNATAQVWSPDGTLIAYQSDKSGTADIFVYQLSSNRSRQVTSSADNAQHYAPTWMCDGTTIVFTSDVSGTPNLYSTPALPIDAPPIDVASQGTALTALSGAAAQFPEGSPGQVEESSRLKLLPAITGQG
jgi:TolB protein